MFPKLIVFDFHGCLSLASGTERGVLVGDFENTLKLAEYGRIRINNLKKALRKYKNGSWYSAMVKSKINPYIMMPTLDEVITFVDFIRNNRKDTVFSIASMLEDEHFMYDMMKYCFEKKDKISPFLQDAIISSHSLDNKVSRSRNDKWPHISVILKKLNLPIEKSDIVLIDDTESIVDYMTKSGICSVLVEDYFRISDWNKGCYVPE